MAKKSDSAIKHRIVLEGEKEYKKALTDVNRALRVTASELKENKAAFASAGESQEALRSRLEILNREHAQASEKVQLLTDHLEKVKAAYGENSSEADGMRISLNNAKAALNTIGNEAAEARRRLEQLADSADEAEEELDDLTDKTDGGTEQIGLLDNAVGGLVGQLGQAATGMMTLSTAAGLIKSGLKFVVDVSADAEDAQASLAIQTGLTGDALAALSTGADNLFRTGLFSSQQEASSAITTVYRNTQLTGDALEEATRNAQLLSTSFGTDISDSSRTANSLMQTFGISAKEAYDLMAHGLQNGADGNGDLMDVLREYGPMFAQMGFSSEEFVGVLERGAQSGTFSVDKIGDAMKEFYLRMTDGNTDAKEALGQLGLESADVMQKLAAGGETGRAAFDLMIDALAGVEDPVERNRIAVALFGTQAEDMGYDVVGLFQGVDEAAAEAQGTMQGINDVKMDDLDVQLNRIKSIIASELTPAATGLRDILAGAARNIADGMEIEAENKEKYGTTPLQSAVGMTFALAMPGGTNPLVVNEAKTGFWDAIKKAFSGESEEKTQAQAAAEESGKNTAAGFVSGVMFGVNNAENAGIQLGQSALGGLNQTMQIHSPSRVTEESGENFDEGLVLGIEGGTPDAQRSAQTLARETIDALRRDLDAGTARRIGADWGSGLVEGLRASEGSVRAAAQRLASVIEGATRDALDTHSPSRVGMAIGADWGAGIALGEEASLDGVREAALDIADVMAGASVPSGGGGVGGMELDYEALGEAIADACVRRGLGMGDMVAVFDVEDAADALAPGISSRIARSAAMTVTGRAKRL